MEAEEVPTEEVNDLTYRDFGRICRVCLANSSCINLKPLIPSTLQILRGITQIKIEGKEDDQLPGNICSNCSSFLHDVSVFAETYKFNEGVLKKILNEKLEEDRILLIQQLESDDEGQDNHEVEDDKDEKFESWGKEEQEQDDYIPMAELVQEEDSEDDKPLHLIKQEQQKENSTKLANNTETKEMVRKITRNVPLKTVRRKNNCKVRPKIPKEENESKIPVCITCNMTFTSKTKLCSHYKENESCRPEWFETFQCKVCEKEFSTERRRDEHLNLHTGETPYVCSFCGKGFQLYTAHYKHVYRHKLALGLVELKPGYMEKRVNLNLQCDQCPKIFASRSGFANHLLMHKGIKVVYKRRLKKTPVCKDKRFLCSVCGNSFRTKVQLEGHTRFHTGERPFNCQFCNKEFRTRGSLRIHEMNHLGTTPKRYICEFCNKPFSLKAHYEVHKRTHTGEKPHSCNFCGKSFNYQGTLKIHLRLHTGETPYVCPVCRNRYHDRSALNKHQKKQRHEGEPIIEDKGMHDLRMKDLAADVVRLHKIN